jgi:putative sterol carrier protein
MTERFQYLSDSWQQEVKRKVNAEVTPKQLKKMTTALVLNYRDYPDEKGCYLCFFLEKGVLEKVAILDSDPPNADFFIIADYATFVRINKAELGSKTALVTGKVKLKGSMFKAVKLASVSDMVTKTVSMIPTDY